MKRLIDADDLKRALVTNGFKNDIDMMMTLETINNATTIDAVPLDGSFLKMSRGDYLIYNRHWLYEHFDMEMEIQRSAMKSMGYEPAIKEAETVRHGKWQIEISNYGNQATYRCSECGHRFKWVYDQHFPPVFNYCQKCGSRMDEE